MGKSKCRIDDNGRECTSCHEYKPWDAYSKGRGRNGKDVQCKVCGAAKSLAYYHANREARSEYWKGYYDKNKEHLVERATEWKREHPEANRQHSRDDYHRNKEARKAAHTEWVKNNPEKAKACDRAKVKRKPELYRAIRREAVKRYSANWPDKIAHFEQRRRAAKLQAQPKWANEGDIQAVFSLARAMRDGSGFKYHVDHIIPLQHDLVCGLHVANNLRVVCADDNLRKHNKFVPGDVVTDDMPSVQLSDTWTSEFAEKVVALARRAYNYKTKPVSFYEHLNRLRVGCGMPPVQLPQNAQSSTF